LGWIIRSDRFAHGWIPCQDQHDKPDKAEPLRRRRLRARPSRGSWAVARGAADWAGGCDRRRPANRWRQCPISTLSTSSRLSWFCDRPALRLPLADHTADRRLCEDTFKQGLRHMNCAECGAQRHSAFDTGNFHDRLWHSDCRRGEAIKNHLP
jgi:hypothetical protein